MPNKPPLSDLINNQSYQNKFGEFKQLEEVESTVNLNQTLSLGKFGSYPLSWYKENHPNLYYSWLSGKTKTDERNEDFKNRQTSLSPLTNENTRKIRLVNDDIDNLKTDIIRLQQQSLILNSQGLATEGHEGSTRLVNNHDREWNLEYKTQDGWSQLYAGDVPVRLSTKPVCYDSGWISDPIIAADGSSTIGIKEGVTYKFNHGLGTNLIDVKVFATRKDTSNASMRFIAPMSVHTTLQIGTTSTPGGGFYVNTDTKYLLFYVNLGNVDGIRFANDVATGIMESPSTTDVSAFTAVGGGEADNAQINDCLFRIIAKRILI